MPHIFVTLRAHDLHDTLDMQFGEHENHTTQNKVPTVIHMELFYSAIFCVADKRNKSMTYNFITIKGKKKEKGISMVYFKLFYNF